MLPRIVQPKSDLRLKWQILRMRWVLVTPGCVVATATQERLQVVGTESGRVLSLGQHGAHGVHIVHARRSVAWSVRVAQAAAAGPTGPKPSMAAPMWLVRLPRRFCFGHRSSNPSQTSA